MLASALSFPSCASYGPHLFNHVSGILVSLLFAKLRIYFILKTLKNANESLKCRPEASEDHTMNLRPRIFCYHWHITWTI